LEGQQMLFNVDPLSDQHKSFSVSVIIYQSLFDQDHIKEVIIGNLEWTKF
jgi:hypothetical protein